MGAVDGDAVVAFCKERAERMKHPLTAAIYMGLVSRVERGFFAPGARDGSEGDVSD